ncbi:hypothetical protein [Microbacterium sp. CFBP9034]|uniref:hypothetical protein n=1 Tax=Microbacterium sp. CFBP9034 TaxID=3096540 RepID=UPI002A6B7BAC|nr:hypothetical protein [Microbacterium sp. CFBP9034]MDY0909382.1 hypothetical protein [Microbacterium sp. CFBP9034]
MGMQMIMYSGGQFLTGDDIAAALLEYSRALGEEDTAKIVEIPILEEDGSRAIATFLIGPASQIVTKSVRTDLDELVDAEVVQWLRRQARGITHPEAAETDEDQENWALMPKHGDIG